ncbi:MAG: hypothetical protein WAT41_10705, partial [Flavobacteriales bacterium]
MADTPTQNFGSLPDTLTFGPFNSTGEVTVHLVNLVEGCPPYVENIGVPFVCAGEGYGSITIGDDTSDVFVYATDGYFSLRSTDDGSIQTFDAGYALISIGGQYCLYASDDSGTPSGELTNLTFESGGFSDMSIGDLPLEELVLLGPSDITDIPDISENAELKGIMFGGLSNLESIPSMSANAALEVYNLSTLPLITEVPSLDTNTALTTLFITLLELVESLPSLAANINLTNVRIQSCPLLTLLPSLSTQAGLTTAKFLNLPSCDTLPDFAPTAQVEISVWTYPGTSSSQKWTNLKNVGVLPRIKGTHNDFISCSLTQTAVDALYNACDPSFPNGKMDTSGGTSPGPSAASATNRAACVSN